MRKKIHAKQLLICSVFYFKKTAIFRTVRCPHVQKESETIADFIKALAENCDFGEFINEALRDRLVCGLKSESIQSKLMDQSPQVDFVKVCQLALSMETSKFEAKRIVVRKSPRQKGSTRSVSAKLNII
jgi:hypothetical protein